jgi:hypothetical protein
MRTTTVAGNGVPLGNEGGFIPRRARRHWPKFALLILYIAVTLSASLAHAMGREEIQAWLIARDSADLSALFHNLDYEGHAALWYLLLLPLTRLSRDPLLMQLLHVAIATVTVGLVPWRAPLSSLEQALFPFGYFFLYADSGFRFGALVFRMVLASLRTDT